MSDHALFSPSSAHRWMECPGSLALTQIKFPDGQSDSSNEYSAEGTAAHELASMAYGAGMPAETFIGMEITVGEYKFTVDQEMADHVQEYLDSCARQPGIKVCEVRLDLSSVLAVPKQFGTADKVSADTESRTLYVNDLKFGRGEQVFAKENPQLMLYALGAGLEFDALGPFKNYVLAIHQPRLGHYDEWTISQADLVAFAKKARAAVKRAQEAFHVDEETLLAEYINPGPKQCRWCPVKGECVEYAKAVEAEVAGEFEDVRLAPEPEQISALMTPARLAEAVSKVDWIKQWCQAVSDRAHAILMAGDELPGFKLVRGRAGARAWGDAEVAEQTLKTARLKKEEMYNFKLISPTQAEKSLAKAKPRVWKKLAGLIVQPEGKLHLAPEDDKRPSETPTGAVADEFEDLSGDAGS